MKIFAIYTNLIITDGPEWLHSFREKYDVPYAIHITLTQPRFVAESNISMLKSSIVEYFQNKHLTTIELTFSDYHLDRQDATNDGCIMISTTERNILSAIQKDLLSLLLPYQDYFENKTKNYEETFIPHITIGRHLAKETFDEAISSLPSEVSVKAEINEIVLAVVADKSARERKDPKNLTIYKLPKK